MKKEDSMKVYIATTQGLKYDYMVISETEEKAWQQLRKWWNNTWGKEDGCCSINHENNFKDATEWHGVYVRSTPIRLHVPFDICN